MNKKILSFFICVSFLLLNAVSSASDSVMNYAYFEELKNLKIVNCYENGSFLPEKNITRAEFCKMVSKMLCIVEGEIEINCEVFSDVPLHHWANEYITFCYINDLVNGIVKGDKVFFVTTEKGKETAIDNLEINESLKNKYSVSENVAESIFDPDGYVTIQDAVKMLVIALGYEPLAELNGKYPNGYLHVAKEVGLIGSGVSGTNHLTRGEAVEVIYKALHMPLFLSRESDTQISYYVADGEDGNQYLTLYSKLFLNNTINN